ncbi:MULTISPECIES: ABC transporter substrate-binding protein [Ramlibacter]|nr:MULTISPECIES: ABC transporter substrate-binding protein [Ramlibacter]
MVALLAVLSLTAGAAEDGAGKAIVLGQSVALTGPGSALAVPFQQGARLWFERVNAAGGIGGRRIELVTLDDKGAPATTAANTKKLLDQGVLSLFGYFGSPQVTAAYPLVKDGDVVLFAPMAAADEFRGAAYGNVWSVRPGYAEEAVAITRHAETLGARKLAILYGTDGESLAALDAAERTMPHLGANLVAKQGLAAGAVDKTLASKPESVLVVGDATQAAGAVRELRAKGFRGTVYAFSSSGESLLAQELGTAGTGVVVVRVVPKSDSTKVPVVRELLADAQAAKLGKPNVYMLEGYLAARVYTEALRRMAKGDPSRAKLRKALEGMDDLDVGGFRVSYTDNRAGSRLVELSLIDSQGRVRE